MVKIIKPNGTISLFEAAKLTGYHQDYLGQLCRAGKLQAIKVGRNWYTTEDAVRRYFEQGAQLQPSYEDQPMALVEEEEVSRPAVYGLPIALQEPGDTTAHVLTEPIHGGWTVQSYSLDPENESATHQHSKKSFRNSHLRTALVVSAAVVVGLVVASTLLTMGKPFLGEPFQTVVNNFDAQPGLFQDKSVAGAVDESGINFNMDGAPSLKPGQWTFSF